jgi:phosphopantetheinyl transferase
VDAVNPPHLFWAYERWTALDDAPTVSFRSQQSAAARTLCQKLLAAHGGMPGTAWQIGNEPDGRPFAAALSKLDVATAAPAISLAHSGGWVACCLSLSGPVGIDIEADHERRPHRDAKAIAALAFGPREQSNVATGGEAAFYRIWTMREAIAKACGRGIDMAADQRDRVPDCPASGIWRAELDSRCWLLGHFTPSGGVAISVAWERSLAVPDPRNHAVFRLP